VLDSVILYCGAAALGGAIVALPWRKTRRGAVIVAIAGALMIVLALALPVRNEWWQFREQHEIGVNAPPDRVYRAIREVRANEITLFNTLTAIRRGFRKTNENILNAGADKPLLDVATKSGFRLITDKPPSEVVLATRIGNGVAVMNFLVTPTPTGSHLSTETRVHCNDARTLHAFTVYWRIIHPGSDIIRRMWLRAIKRRAESH